MHVGSIFQHRDLLPVQRLEQPFSRLEFESDLILCHGAVCPVQDLVNRQTYSLITGHISQKSVGCRWL